MRRAPLHAVALAALLLVAGCGGLFGGDAGAAGPSETSATPTVTDSADRSTRSTATSESNVTNESVDAPASVPPGVTDGVVTEPMALATAHARALSNASYTARSVTTVRSSENGPSDTVLYRSTDTARIENRSRYLLSFAVSGDEGRFLDRGNGSITTYADGDRIVRRIATGANATYGVEYTASGDERTMDPARIGGWNPRADERIYADLGAVNATVAGTTTQDGEALNRIEGSNATDPSLLVSHANLSDPRAATLSAVVGSDGRVRTMTVTLTATWTRGDHDGETVRVERRLTYRDYGETTVDRPAWYDRAVNRSATGGNGAVENGTIESGTTAAGDGTSSSTTGSA